MPLRVYKDQEFIAARKRLLRRIYRFLYDARSRSQIRGIPAFNEVTSDERFPASCHEEIEVDAVCVFCRFVFEWTAAGLIATRLQVNGVRTRDTSFWSPPPPRVFWRRRGRATKGEFGEWTSSIPTSIVIQKLLPLPTQSHLLENGPKETIILNRMLGYNYVVSVGPAQMTNNPPAIIDYWCKACFAEVRASGREHATVQ